MDFGKSFTYMFEDPNWVAKLGIGGAILLVGILFSWLVLPIIAAAIILLGYGLVVLKNVAENNPMPLPEWNDFGGLFMKGLYAFVGGIIWFLPVIILSCCLGLANAVLANASAGSGSSSDTVSGLTAVLTSCLGCLVSIVSFVVGVTFYAPLSRYAVNGQLNTFWDLSGNLKFIQANLGNYIIALLLSLVANFIAGFGIIACIIGVAFTGFWGNLVSYHLFGQVLRNASSGYEAMPPASPMAPPPMSPTMP